jgi:flagellar basal-body rod protein FlgB
MKDMTIQALVTSMSLRLQRHAAIAGNIANADTPGYRPRQVAFEDDLQRALSSGDSQRLSSVNPRTLIVDDHSARPDGNSVSMDKQMANLAENSLVYNATAEFLARKMRMMKSVIS